MTFDLFATVTEQIVEWISLLLAVILVYYGWLIIKDPAKTAAEAGLEGGSKLGGWLKGKGYVPFTKEHKEKYGNYEISKRAFKLEMDGYTRDSDELKKMEKVMRYVAELQSKKNKLERGRIDAPKDFKKFLVEVKAVNVAFEEETKGWTRESKWYRRRWPEYMSKMGKVIKELEANKEIDADTIDQIKVAENKVMALHDKTKEKIAALQSLMGELLKVVGKVAGYDYETTEHVDYAREELTAFDFTPAMDVANEAVELQQQTVKDLKALIAASHKVIGK